MSIGTNIKERRYELNMSQQQLADLLGYKTRSTIAKIESGENDVTQKKLQKFAAALDTTVERLLFGAGHAASNPLQARQSSAFDQSRAAFKQKAVAVILAGGKSSRNHQNIPNQFISIAGKPVIVYCLEAYEAHPFIDDIYIVCLKGWEQIVSAYAQQYGITKLRGLIPAAPSGILSVRNGLNHIKTLYSGDDLVIFQEATRPMVSVEMISNLIRACEENGSANICQSMRDYVQFTYKNGIASYVDRDSVVDLQSPEAYRIHLIDEVFRKAYETGHALTESCCVMLMYNLGYRINFIEGSVNNIKIVRQEDISIFEALLKPGN